MMELSLQIFFSFVSACGAHEFGRAIANRFGIKKVNFSISYFFLGGLAAVVFESFMVVLLMSASSTLAPIAHLPKLIFFLVGVSVVTKWARRQDLKVLCLEVALNPFAYVLFFVTIVFLPSFRSPPLLHPSWDSDAVRFWLPKFLSIVENGFLPFTQGATHPDYFSFFNRMIGHFLLPLTMSSIFLGARVFSLFTILWGISCVTSGWSIKWRFAFTLVAFSGFPLKWINGYQDSWLAFFFVSYICCVLRDFDFEAVLYLALTACSKNEGIVAAVLFFPFLPKRDLKSVLIFLICLSPMLTWKLLFKISGYANADLHLQVPEYDILLERIVIWCARLAKALGRSFQSYWLDGFLATVILGVMKKYLSKRERWIYGMLIVSALAPQIVVLLTPFDYIWHMETTMSRVSTSGLLGLVFLAFYKLDQTFPLDKSARSSSHGIEIVRY